MPEPYDLDADPIFRILMTGRAQNLQEAERLYLDEALPEVYALLAGPLTGDELARHPLVVMYLRHGSRPWEDALARTPKPASPRLLPPCRRPACRA